ncbi:GNAT family N-acetyltransferase [Nocardioides montaniterrae]
MAEEQAEGEFRFVPEPVETDRLLLRLIEPSDLDELLVYRALPEVCRYIPPVPWTRELGEEQLATPWRMRRDLTGEGQHLWFAVVRRDDGVLIGDGMLFWHSEANRSGEIGYVVRPQDQGHGYATELARGLLSIAFDGLGLRRVVGRVDTRNPASTAVLTRAGMRQEAVLVENELFKGEWTSEIDFAILDREWRAQG